MHKKIIFVFILSQIFIILIQFYCYPSFDNIGFGVRPAGLCYSYTAIADDVNSIFYNPAGLGRMRQPELFVEYDKLYLGLDDNSSPGAALFIFGMPLSVQDAFGAGYYNFSTSDIYSESILLGSYSKTLTSQLITGITGKILMKSIGKSTVDGDPLSGKTNSGFDIDIGLIYKYSKLYTLGASITNIMRPNLALTPGYDDKPQRSIAIGAAYREKLLNLNLQIEMQEKISSNYCISSGIEQWFVPSEKSIVGLRVGMLLNTNKNFNATIGLSYRTKDMQIDYALKWQLTGLLDVMGTHYIGLLMKFKPEREIKFVEDLPEFVYVPPPISESVKIEYQSAVSYYRDQVTKGIPLSTQIGLVKSIISKYEPQGIDVTELKTELKTLEEKLQKQTSEEARTRASELTQEGIKEYQNGNYMNSLKNLSEASALVPEDKTISNLKRKLESLAVVVVEIPGTDKTSEMLRKGINAYLEDDIPKSMNILRYLYEKNPKNITISKVLKLIEIEHPEIPLRDNYNPSVGLINMKLDRALQHIYNEEYTAAIAECNEILELEPNNVMALIRLGSAYYSLKNISKATEYWSKALALDPNNIELNEFIRDAKLNIKPGMVPKKTTVESKTKKYIVQKGDTLPKIAEKVYGDKTKWRKIFDANKNILDNPYSLSVGQELTIP